MLRIRDVYPGSGFFPIPDPGSKNSNKREGWKKFCCHTFLCSNKFHKIENYFSFEVLKEKIWANFQRTIELFTQKIVTKLSKIWLWDPGSGKNLFRIPDPVSRGQKGTGSRIPDPGPQYWLHVPFKRSVVVDFCSSVEQTKRMWIGIFIESVEDPYADPDLGSVPLASVSGKPKNIRIRIRNTGTYTSFFKDKKS